MSFSSIDRADAQRELTELLQRAMKSVPFVRLDKVDDVTEKFQSAVLYLENHTINPIVLDSEYKHEQDDDGDQKPSEGAASAYKPIPLGNKAVLERTSFTSDYSSPSLGRRSLTAKGVSEMNKLVQPSKPSSRAESSGRGLGSLRRGSDDDDDTTNAVGPISSSSVSTVTATTSSMNSDVSSQTTKAVTTDYSSPKLGGRSLASKKKYAPSGRTGKADNEDEDRPRSDSDKENAANSNLGGVGAGVGGGVQQAGAHHGGPAHGPGLGLHKKADVQSEQQQEEHVELAKAGLTPQMKARFKTGDLLAHTPQYKIATANQVLPDYVGSPAQRSRQATLLEKEIEKAKDPGARIESPKPAFLRRLDSPETHSGKLLKKKATLEQLIKRALNAVPNMDLNEFAAIKANFLEAVMLLEASTATDASNNHQ